MVKSVRSQTSHMRSRSRRARCTICSKRWWPKGFSIATVVPGAFSLGIKLIELGYCAQTGLDLVRIAAPFLKGLNMRFDETVHLVVLDNDEVLYIDCIESQRRLPDVFGDRDTGPAVPALRSARQYLAFLPDAEIHRIVAERGLSRFTENTITTEERLSDRDCANPRTRLRGRRSRARGPSTLCRRADIQRAWRSLRFGKPFGAG